MRPWLCPEHAPQPDEDAERLLLDAARPICGRSSRGARQPPSPDGRHRRHGAALLIAPSLRDTGRLRRHQRLPPATRTADGRLADRVIVTDSERLWTTCDTC